MLIRRSLALSALFLLGATTLAAEAPTYSIKFERPFKAGDSFGYSANRTVHDTKRIEAPDGQNQAIQQLDDYSLNAEYTVLKVDANGQETSVKLTVSRFTQRTNNAGAISLLLPGAEITLNYSPGQVTIAQTNGRLSDDSLAALKKFFPAHGKITNDVRYGATEPKKVGDAWPINSKAIASAMPLVVDPANITGAVTFKDIKTVSGVECAQLEYHVTIKDVPDPSHPKENVYSTLVAIDLPTDINHAPMGTAARQTTHIVTEEALLNRGIIRTTEDTEITHTIGWTPHNK